MSWGLPRRTRLLLLLMVALAHAGLLFLIKLEPATSLQTSALAVAIEMPEKKPQSAPQRSTSNTPIHRSTAIQAGQPQSPMAAPATQPLTPAMDQRSEATTSTAADKTAAAPVFLQSAAQFNVAHLNNPAPDYPALAQRRGWEGRVVLKVQVLSSGLAGEIQLQQSSGYTVLDEAASAAVRHWRFIAARRGDVAVEDWVSVPLEFRLKNGTP